VVLTKELISFAFVNQEDQIDWIPLAEINFIRSWEVIPFFKHGTPTIWYQSVFGNCVFDRTRQLSAFRQSSKLKVTTGIAPYLHFTSAQELTDIIPGARTISPQALPRNGTNWARFYRNLLIVRGLEQKQGHCSRKHNSL
jgi:hypothetical protein